MNRPRVSVVLPVFNAARYVASAIRSVLAQSIENWELIVVDDGSVDESPSRIQPFLKDTRIRYVFQQNQGVSVARNTGLDLAVGDWVCFLDADDELYPDSLRARLRMANEDPTLHFIDGIVRCFDESMERQTSEWRPRHRGPVLDNLLFDTASCFMGVTWLVRNSPGLLRFRAGLTHGEDLLFFIMNAERGTYAGVPSPIVKVRRGHASAMTNIAGLERGYRSILATVGEPFGLLPSQIQRLRNRYRMVLVKSYLKDCELRAAFRVWSTF